MKPPPRKGIQMANHSASWQVLEWISEDCGKLSDGPLLTTKQKTDDRPATTSPKSKKPREARCPVRGKGKVKEEVMPESRGDDEKDVESTEEDETEEEVIEKKMTRREKVAAKQKAKGAVAKGGKKASKASKAKGKHVERTVIDAVVVGNR